MSSSKEIVATLLDNLPAEATLEDIQYHIYVVEKVRRGLERASQEGTLSQDEVEARLQRWLPA